MPKAIVLVISEKSLLATWLDNIGRIATPMATPKTPSGNWTRRFPLKVGMKFQMKERPSGHEGMCWSAEEEGIIGWIRFRGNIFRIQMVNTLNGLTGLGGLLRLLALKPAFDFRRNLIGWSQEQAGMFSRYWNIYPQTPILRWKSNRNPAIKRICICSGCLNFSRTIRPYSVISYSDRISSYSHRNGGFLFGWDIARTACWIISLSVGANDGIGANIQ